MIIFSKREERKIFLGLIFDYHFFGDYFRCLLVFMYINLYNILSVKLWDDNFLNFYNLRSTVLINMEFLGVIFVDYFLSVDTIVYISKLLNYQILNYQNNLLFTKHFMLWLTINRKESKTFLWLIFVGFFFVYIIYFFSKVDKQPNVWFIPLLFVWNTF